MIFVCFTIIFKKKQYWKIILLFIKLHTIIERDISDENVGNCMSSGTARMIDSMENIKKVSICKQIWQNIKNSKSNLLAETFLKQYSMLILKN